MRNFKNIVVGVDLDERGSSLTAGSTRALQQAEWLAWKNGGRVELVHSSNVDRYVEMHEGRWAIVHEGVSDAGGRALEAAAEKLRATEIEASISVLEDRPAIALCRKAAESKADLVLLGKHEGLDEATKIGTVAASVLRNCPAPVWVVKPGAELTPRIVVSATDLTEVGSRAVAYGGFVADESEATLHVLHAYQIELQDQMSRGSETDFEAIQQRATTAVQEQIKKAELSQDPTLHVTCNSPSKAILQADKQLKPDLIVMGTVSRDGIPGLLLGNTAERVLPRLNASLLTVKPQDFESPIPGV